jgi:hypothetical protein
VFDINISEGKNDDSQPEAQKGFRAVVVEMRGDGFFVSQNGNVFFRNRVIFTPSVIFTPPLGGLLRR